MKLGIDFDDVLIDLHSGLRDFHNTEYGTSYEVEDVKQYELGRTWGCDPDEAVRRVQEFYYSEHHTNLLPIESALVALEQLKESHSFTIITGRPEDVREETTALLREHFPPYLKEIHFLGNYHGEGSKRTKGDICKELGIDIFLEDALAHALSVAEKDIPVLLFDKPWNQGKIMNGITRIYNWNEAIVEIQKQASQK